MCSRLGMNMRLYRVILPFIFLLLATGSVFSQPCGPIPSYQKAQMSNFWEHIDELIRKADYESALEKLRQARDSLESKGDTCSALAIDTWIAKVYVFKLNLRAAVSSLRNTKRQIEQDNCDIAFLAFKDLGKAVTALEYNLKGLDFLIAKKLNEGLSWMEKARDTYLEIDDQDLSAAVTLMMGAHCFDNGEYQSALRYLNWVLESPASIGNPHLRMVTLGGIGCCHGLLGQHEEAQRFLEGSYREAQRIEIMPSNQTSFVFLGYALDKVANDCEVSSRYRKALIYHDYQLRYISLIDNLKWKSGVLVKMGMIHLKLFQLEKTIECSNQVLDISRFTNDLLMQEFSLRMIATAYHGLGQWKKSNEYLDQALRLNKMTNDQASKSAILAGLGHNLVYTGRTIEAIGYLKKALLLCEELDDMAGQMEALVLLTPCYDSLEDIEEAIECQKRLLNLARETSDHETIASALEGLSYLHRKLGDSDSAVHFWLEGFRFHTSTQNLTEVMSFLSGDESRYLKERRYDAAFHDLEAELSSARRRGDLNKEILCHIFLARLHYYQGTGDLETPVHHLDIAKQLNERIKNSELEVYILYSKAHHYMFYEPNDQKAFGYLQEILRIAEGERDVPLQLHFIEYIAEYYRIMGRPLEAAECFRHGLEIAQESGDRSRQGDFYRGLGQISYLTGDFHEAIDHGEKALAISRECDEVEKEFSDLSRIASAHLMLSHFEQAETYAKEALEGFIRVKDFSGSLLCLSMLGYANSELGKNSLAFYYLNDAFRILPYVREITAQNEFALTMSLALAKLGFYQGALKTLSVLLAREEFTPRTDIYLIGETYSAMGLTYASMGDHQKAQLYLEKSLNFLRNSRYQYGEATVLNKLAEVSSESGQYDMALEYLDRAEDVFQDIGNVTGQLKNTLLKGYVAGNRLLEEGKGSVEVGEWERIIHRLREALELSRDTGDQRNEATALLMLGTYHRRLAQYHQAESYLQDAVSVANENYIPEVSIAANSGLGKIYEEKDKYLEALECYQEAIESVETLQSGLSWGLLKGKFFAKRREAYDSCFRVLVKLNQIHPGQGYDVLAFTTGEKAKARSLLDGIRRVRSLESKEPGLNLLLGGEIRRFQDRLQAVTSSAERTSLRRDFEILRDEVSLWKSLLEDRKEPETLPERAPTPDIRHTEIQSVMDDTALLVEYVMSENEFYMCVITDDRLEIRKLPLGGKNLQELVRDYVGTLRRPYSSKTEFSRHLELGKELFRVLLSPVENEIRTGTRLIVVPDGCLHYLPFEALILSSPNGSPQSYAVMHDVPYLISKTSVAYFHSGAVMLSIMQPMEKDREIGKTEYEILAFGDPIYQREEKYAELEIDRRDHYGKRGFGFDRLPYSGEEILSIAKTLGIDPASECINLREKASERRVHNLNLAKYKRIHFATHGILADEITWINQPALVLSLSEADDEFDGFLDTGEIYDLDLNADLVVLSACKTGLGEEIRGEGLVGLTHAFMHAGAESLVVSLWDVNDRSTSLLMETFYRNLETMNKRDALRQAKLDLMNSESAPSRQRGVGGVVGGEETKDIYSHPYYWAPFVLIGKYD